MAMVQTVLHDGICTDNLRNPSKPQKSFGLTLALEPFGPLEDSTRPIGPR